MLKYAFNPSPKKSAKVYGRSLDISPKDAVEVCRAINRRHLSKGEGLLEGLVKGRKDINGKYYTKSARQILELLKSARSNAEFKGLEEDKLHIYASAHKGFSMSTGRRDQVRGQKRLYTHVQLVLVER